MIAFITIYVRTPNLVAEPINTSLFLSFKRALDGSQKQITQIILNIALFIPLGYLLADYTGRKTMSILIALFVSLIIESIQYFSFRGQIDVDDLIYNSIGSAVGIVLFQIVNRWNGRQVIPYVLLAAGVVGCFIAVQRSESSTNYTKQFDFHVTSSSCFDNVVKLAGTCEIYGRETPPYDLFLDGVKMDTVVEEDRFIASNVVAEGKHEIFVKFVGYDPISTGTYVSLSFDEQVNVEYVPEEVEILFSIPDDYILKAYNQNQSTYVFQDENRLLWYIGWDITPSTIIIYHISTNEPEKMPEKRIQYGFDNHDFRSNGSNELESESGYRVFEKDIPDTYNVAAITVGFDTDGEVTWDRSFRLE